MIRIRNLPDCIDFSSAIAESGKKQRRKVGQPTK